jgi:hypothetical protein
MIEKNAVSKFELPRDHYYELRITLASGRVMALYLPAGIDVADVEKAKAELGEIIGVLAGAAFSNLDGKAPAAASRGAIPHDMRGDNFAHLYEDPEDDDGDLTEDGMASTLCASGRHERCNGLERCVEDERITCCCACHTIATNGPAKDGGS